MESEKTENEYMVFWYEEGILHSEFKKSISADLESAKSLIAFRHQVSNHSKQYWCYDLGGLKYSTKEGYQYMGVHGQDCLHACALIVNSHLAMFIVNIFMKLSKVTIPLKIFRKKEDAVAWLKEIKAENERAN